MKINKEKVKERLASVPESSRSHIYDASIVLEFLTATFMPTKFFLPKGFVTEPGTQLGAKSMRKVSEGKSMMLRDLYDLYLLFREEKDYTARIESRYIFGIIVRHLRFYKNDWEFVVYRVGSAQIWHLGPLVMRKNVAAEVRSKFSPKFENKEVEAVTVEADPVAEPEEDERGIDLIRDELGPDAPRVTVILEEDRFVEVKEAPTIVIGIDRNEGGHEDKSVGLLGHVENGALVVDKVVEIKPDSRFKEAKGNVRPDLYEEPERRDELSGAEMEQY